MRKWECTVCGYIHEGDEPPEKCPVCGADRSKFVEVTEQDAPAAEAAAEIAGPAIEAEFVSDESSRTLSPAEGPKTTAQALSDTVKNLMIRHHAHPILVHIPNGVVPVSFAMALLAVLLKSDKLSYAVEFNLLFVMLSMPLVLFSGYLDWKKKYNGAFTSVFITKMACGGLVTLGSAVLYFWMLKDHNVLITAGKWMPFVVTHLAVLGAGGAAGFFGGKLVFRD